MFVSLGRNTAPEPQVVLERGPHVGWVLVRSLILLQLG